MSSTHTPAELSRRRRIGRRVSGFVLDYLIALPAGCAAALLWANTLPDSYYRFAQSVTRKSRHIQDDEIRAFLAAVMETSGARKGLH